jgi:outer membrane biogenesis lipoprotein LolB
MRYAPLAVAAMALAACSAPSSSQPQPSSTAASEAAALQTDQDKTLYALGLAIGGNVREFQLTEA